MTLEEISHQTKIHTRFLEAIEHDDLNVLPAKAFAKGFLRSYARMVGLDEEMVITIFEYCHRILQTTERLNPCVTIRKRHLVIGWYF
jgi:cytoskeletal protein RodZ